MNAELTELQSRIAHLHDLAALYAPHYAQADVEAAWRDICELIGIEAEALAMQAARECQSPMWAELWSPV
jgi:hypothetical protein